MICFSWHSTLLLRASLAVCGLKTTLSITHSRIIFMTDIFLNLGNFSHALDDFLPRKVLTILKYFSHFHFKIENWKEKKIQFHKGSIIFLIRIFIHCFKSLNKKYIRNIYRLVSKAYYAEVL